MIVFFLFNSIFNPSLALNILLPVHDTYQLSGHIYHCHLENSFPKTMIEPGIFIEGFIKEYFPAQDDYFRNSGKPFTILAGGFGATVNFHLIDCLRVSYGAGYFIGKFTYPVVQDSGRIVVQHDHRHSIGVNGSLAMLRSFNKLHAGIRACVNIIPFGTRNEESNNMIPPNINRASLVSVGIGIQVGVNL